MKSSAFGWWRRGFFGRPGAERRASVSAHREANPVAWSSMAAFLEDLEVLADEFPEVLDTDVRERMFEVVQNQLLAQSEGVAVPGELGMFSPEANGKLQELLTLHLAALRDVFAVFELDSEKKRRVSFFNSKLRTERGTRVEDFFGQP